MGVLYTARRKTQPTARGRSTWYVRRPLHPHPRPDQARAVSLAQIDFSTLPSEAIFEYLVQHDLVPDVEPSPLASDDPPPPSALLRPRSSQARRHADTASPGPAVAITPANRPRREVPARRRSARLVEDSGVEPVIPVLADVHEVHGMLAQVAQRHFREHPVREVDTLASFMCAVKAKGMSNALAYLDGCSVRSANEQSLLHCLHAQDTHALVLARMAS